MSATLDEQSNKLTLKKEERKGDMIILNKL